jgi:putative phage-type endonuclease
VSEKKSNIVSDSDLVQGSPLWLAARKKGIGSSDIATIMGQNPYKTARELWLEKTGAVEPPDLSNNYAIKRGQALEPVARNLFNETVQKDFQPVTFSHKEYLHFKASADGYCFDSNEILEIKSCGKNNHIKIVDTNAVLPYYMPQVQWLLMLSEATKCYFIAYNPDFPHPMHIIEVLPDQDMFEAMSFFAHRFWQAVESKTELDWDYA